VALLLRRRQWDSWSAAAIGAAVYGVFAMGLMGPPGHGLFEMRLRALLTLAWHGALLAALVRAMRTWPVAELTAVALLALSLGWGFPPVLAWHMYWATAFVSMVAAIALVSLAEWVWGWGAGRVASQPAVV
jgi:hypothetical protein